MSDDKKLKRFKELGEKMHEQINGMISESLPKYMMLLKNSPNYKESRFKMEALWASWDRPFFAIFNAMFLILENTLGPLDVRNAARFFFRYEICYSMFHAFQEKLGLEMCDANFDEFKEAYANLMFHYLLNEHKECLDEMIESYLSKKEEDKNDE